MIELRCEKCGKTYVFIDSWSGRQITCECGARITVPAPQWKTVFDRLSLEVIDSYRFLPVVTVRVVCFYSSQDVIDFRNRIKNLFSDTGARFSGFEALKNVKAEIREAVRQNPALDRGTAYLGWSTKAACSGDTTEDGMRAAIQEIKSAGVLPSHIVLLPIVGAIPSVKQSSVEQVLDLLQALGDRDWQQGLPSVIVPITDGDHKFRDLVEFLPLARYHALFFGYKPEERVERLGL